MIKKQKHRGKNFIQNNPSKMILSLKLPMICVQNEINSELN